MLHCAYEGCLEARRVVQHLENSALFDFSPFRKSCQLVYVDGAHSMAYVSNDTGAAFDIVSDPGVIVWDDYQRRVPDVRRFLHTLADRRLVRLPGSRRVGWFSPQALHRSALNQ